MTEFTPFSALLGGVLIGIASVLCMGMLGRIAGISGMIHGLLRGDFQVWRIGFLVGLVMAGVMAAAWGPVASRTVEIHPVIIIVAGLLVGIGTRIGSGCTSGHGVCGLARRSLRSAVAVCIFMGCGILTVTILRHWWI